MSTIVDDLAALFGGVQKVVDGATEVGDAAARGLARTAAVADHLTQPDTVDRIVGRTAGALVQSMLDEAQQAPSPAPSASPSSRRRVRQQPPRRRR